MSKRNRLLDAASEEFRKRGFAGTSVDALCAASGVTKGAFFHHFASKDELGAAAAEYWGESTAEIFAQAPYHRLADPLERVLAYIDLRQSMIEGEIARFTCLAGTIAQEVFAERPEIRAACWRAISDHAATLEADIEAAMAKSGVAGTTPRSLALYIQASLQGAFVLAKAKNDASVAREMIGHVRRYFELEFTGRVHGQAGESRTSAIHVEESPA